MITSNIIIELKEIYKSFNHQKIFNGLSLSVPRGQITTIIGPSGSGKSLLLKHIVGLVKPDSGQILIDGQNINNLKDYELNKLRRRFGMLFQNAALFDSMNVGDNIAFPIKEHTSFKKKEIEQLVSKKLSLVGLSGAEQKMPNELSGGMRKRVGLARGIALEPEIILYDEPTTGLDPLLTDSINRLIKKTGERLGITSVVISHDIAGALDMADQVAMLYQGRIIANETPNQFKQNNNSIIQQFIHGCSEGPIKVL